MLLKTSNDLVNFVAVEEDPWCIPDLERLQGPEPWFVHLWSRHLWLPYRYCWSILYTFKLIIPHVTFLCRLAMDPSVSILLYCPPISSWAGKWLNDWIMSSGWAVMYDFAILNVYCCLWAYLVDDFLFWSV